MTARLDLAPKLTVKASENLLESLRGHRGSDVILEAGAVELIGAHAAQTLIVAKESWKRDGRAFSVHNMTEAGKKCLSEMGLNVADICEDTAE